MNRRELFRMSTAAAVTAAWTAPLSAASRADEPLQSAPLQPPATGPIRVAFLLSDGAVVIDFAGPWEVFDNVAMPRNRQENAFQLYTVAATLAPVKVSGGMTIVPACTFATALPPHVIVIPAQGGASAEALDWIRQASASADLTMSVCNGAFVLAKTGLLAGKSATAYHTSYGQFAMRFPDVKLVRGMRFVESGKFASAGGLSSGIDLALHVVERYFGREAARQTAYSLEYQGSGWLDPRSNQVYAARRRGSAQHPLCPVCDMDVAKATAPAATYRSQRYYFCCDEHKAAFDTGPAQFA